MELLVQISRAYNVMPVSFCGDSSALDQLGQENDGEKARAALNAWLFPDKASSQTPPGVTQDNE